MKMSLLNAQIEEQLREVFADMKKDVTLAVFTEKLDVKPVRTPWHL